MQDNLITFIKTKLLNKPISKVESRFPEFYVELLNVTSNMPEDASTPERVWNVLNGFDKNRCILCNKPTKWKNFRLGYRKYCSSKCSNSDNEKKEKIKATMLDKYGVEHALQSKELLDKAKNTLLENYGVDSPLKSAEIKQKVRSTNLSKYGAEEWFAVPLARERILSTFQTKYGYNTASSADQIKEKTRQTCLERYGTVFPANAPSIRTKMSMTRGYDNSQKSLYDSGALHVLNDKVKLREMYNSGMSLRSISETLNCSDVTVGNYFRLHGLKLRCSGSSARLEIVDFVRSIYKGAVSVNDRNMLDGKELDIYLPELNLGIEYCGVFWHSDRFLDKNYHKQKFDIASQKGIRLITIFEDEWKYKTEIVKSKISHIIGISKNEKVYARNTIIKDIDDIKCIKTFIDGNHIQGYVNASKHVALYDKASMEVVALVSLKISNDNIEIVRYCTSKNVIGGFSKLLSFIESYAKNIGVRSITTFADLRWSIGELYEKTGFSQLYKLPPDYRYVMGDKTFHKFNFRHKSLRHMHGYDENLSENRNTKNMGIYRIYDCGKIKYEKRL